MLKKIMFFSLFGFKPLFILNNLCNVDTDLIVVCISFKEQLEAPSSYNYYS